MRSNRHKVFMTTPVSEKNSFLENFSYPFYKYSALIAFGIFGYKITQKAYGKKVHLLAVRIISHAAKSQIFIDKRIVPIHDKAQVITNIMSFGGKNGYTYNWLWRIRAQLNICMGGVGLEDRHAMKELIVGSRRDVWTVEKINKQTGELLLRSEMITPGKGWLHYQIEANHLIQTATFQSHGIAGNLYWYALLPFHNVIFPSLASKIAKSVSQTKNSL